MNDSRPVLWNVLKDMELKPPARSLLTLSDILADFEQRYPDPKIKFGVDGVQGLVEYTVRSATTRDEAIRLAVRVSPSPDAWSTMDRIAFVERAIHHADRWYDQRPTSYIVSQFDHAFMYLVERVAGGVCATNKQVYEFLLLFSLWSGWEPEKIYLMDQRTYNGWIQLAVYMRLSPNPANRYPFGSRLSRAEVPDALKVMNVGRVQEFLSRYGPYFEYKINSSRKNYPPDLDITNRWHPRGE